MVYDAPGVRATPPVPGATSHESLGLVARVLWLYGLHMLLWNACFLIGYYLLPEGFMRGSPQTAAGEMVARQSAFWPQFAMTLLFNLGAVAGLSVVLNFNRVRAFPVGYTIPITLGIVGGLIAGTNSFVASDLSRYDVREGMALNLSIGGLEMLGYMLIIVATVRFAVTEYRSWWRWRGAYRPIRHARLRDVRLSREELTSIALGVVAIVVGAYRETAMALGA